VSEERAFELERMWIADLDLQNPENGYNETRGGDGVVDPTGEVGRKISKAMTGKKASDEARHHESEAAYRRKPASKETCHKISEGQRRRGPVNAETCQKRSENARRQWANPTTRKKMMEGLYRARLRQK
jgi:hypothetical protein